MSDILLVDFFGFKFNLLWHTQTDQLERNKSMAFSTWALWDEKGRINPDIRRNESRTFAPESPKGFAFWICYTKWRDLRVPQITLIHQKMFSHYLGFAKLEGTKGALSIPLALHLNKETLEICQRPNPKTTSTSGGTLIPAGRIKAENCARSKFQGHAWTRPERRIWESVSPSPDLWHSENASCMLVTPKTLFKGFSFTVNCKNMTHLELLFCFCESACIADAPKQIQEVHEMDLEKPWESGPISNPQTTEMREFQHVAQEVHDSGFSGFLQVFHMSTMKQAKLHWSFYGGFFLSKTSPLHTIQVTAQLPKWRHSKQCWLRSSWQGWMGT